MILRDRIQNLEMTIDRNKTQQIKSKTIWIAHSASSLSN